MGHYPPDGCDVTVGGCALSEKMFVWVACVKVLAYECHDPAFSTKSVAL